MTTVNVTVDPETGTLISHEPELFDTAPFELPIPKIDGQRADKLVLTFGGAIELDYTDEEDLELLERFRLGEDVALSVTAKVAGKSYGHATKSESEEVVTYRVALRVHSLDLPELAA